MLDTTLRDGTQAVGVALSLEDKIRLVLLLDGLGVNYIEAGWPASNPKDTEFFNAIKRYGLSSAKIAAFGSTRRKNVKVYEDENVKAILKADVDVAVIFGKAWTLHITEVLHTTMEENLEMIYDTISYLRSHGLTVIFDAEHFYQGYKDSPEYAMSVVKVAEEAGAHAVVLCDTNGGTTPMEVFEITKNVVSKAKAIIGVHMHNDIGCAVANTIMGVAAGARHVQGTINGVGERTGNADLVQVLPTIIFKMGLKALKSIENIRKLKEVSRHVYDILKLSPNPYQPYVGDFAFAHKAGVHIDAVLKNPRTYEHIDPQVVGNTRRIILSDLSGSATVIAYLKDLGIDVDKKDPRVKLALSKIKELEYRGYSFDRAYATAILVILKELERVNDVLKPYGWRIFVDSSGFSVAVVDVKSVTAKAMAIDVVKAITKAFSDAVSMLYPETSSIKISNISVAELENDMFRVTVEASYNGYKWCCQGVSVNVIEALIRGLVDSYEYFLAILKLKPDLFKSQNVVYTQSINSLGNKA